MNRLKQWLTNLIYTLEPIEIYWNLLEPVEKKPINDENNENRSTLFKHN